MIPSSAGLPSDLRSAVSALGRQWASSATRPRPSEEVLAHWDDVVRAWSMDADAPLLVRKHDASRWRRGSGHRHVGGRTLVPVDNAPANWCMASALLGLTPDLPAVLAALTCGDMPVCMARKKGEGDGALYRGTLRRNGPPPNLNALGWKVAHLEPVGLRTSTALTDVPIDLLQERHRRLLSPRNMIVVPMTHGGLAELPEFLEGFLR